MDKDNFYWKFILVKDHCNRVKENSTYSVDERTNKRSLGASFHSEMNTSLVEA